MIEERSAGIIVYRMHEGNRLYLTLRYTMGHWDLVKGHVDAGEDNNTAALRELTEETGIKDIKLDPSFQSEMEYTYTREGDIHHKQVLFFLGEVEKNHVILSYEHTDYAWLSYDEMIDRVTFQTAKDVLKKAEAHLELGG